MWASRLHARVCVRERERSRDPSLSSSPSASSLLPFSRHSAGLPHPAVSSDWVPFSQLKACHLVLSCPINICKFRPFQRRPVSLPCSPPTGRSGLLAPDSGYLNFQNSRGHMLIFASGFLKAPHAGCRHEGKIHKTRAISAKLATPPGLAALLPFPFC